ncbi:MAG: NAD-dependent epimerase/dehydratase family protein [Bacteroidota bacterium]
MKILIAGGAGFVGSNLALSFKKRYPEYVIYCLDNLKRRGSELNLPALKASGVFFVHGDLRQPSDLEGVPDVDVVIDAAAEPSVLAGLSEGLDNLIGTNFNGTIHLLEFAKNCKAKFVFLSTSRVYPIQPLSEIAYSDAETRFTISPQQKTLGLSSNGISEEFILQGSRSFYGSSKLASELFIEEYKQLAGLETIINRCGVICGPRQMGKVDQGVVVLWVAKHFWRKNLAYIGFGGEGKQVRDILHIEDLFELLDLQIHEFDIFNGGVFNVGGGYENSISLLEMTAICQEITGNKIKIDSIAETRSADIPIYITDNTKIHSACKWRPTKDVRTTFQEIHDWLRANEDFLRPILA